jgi:hypothetical protein
MTGPFPFAAILAAIQLARDMERSIADETNLANSIAFHRLTRSGIERIQSRMSKQAITFVAQQLPPVMGWVVCACGES